LLPGENMKTEKSRIKVFWWFLAMLIGVLIWIKFVLFVLRIFDLRGYDVKF